MTDAIDESLLEWLTLNQTHLIIHEYLPIVSFAVMAETLNGIKSWKTFDIGFD